MRRRTLQLLLELLLVKTPAPTGPGGSPVNQFHSRVWVPFLGSMGLAAAVLTGTAGLAAPLDGYQVECVTTAAKEPRPSAMWAVVQRSTAPFTAVGDLLDAFSREFTAQKLDAALLDCPGFEPKAVVIVGQDPRGLAEVPLEVGLQVPGPLEVKTPLALEQLLEPVVVSYTLVGPYEQLDQVYEQIKESLPAGSQPKFPIWLRLLNDPRRVDANSIQTDFIVPIDQPPTLSEDEKARILAAVQAAGPVTYLLASETFHGSVLDIGDFLDRFMEVFQEQGLGDSLASQDTAPVALISSNPDLGGGCPTNCTDVDIEIGLPLVSPKAVAEPLRLHEVAFDKAALYTHMGEYSRLSAIYGEISRVARTAGQTPLQPRFPTALRLLTNPKTVANTDEIKTQFVVPLEPGG